MTQGQTVGDGAKALRGQFNIADVVQRMTAVQLHRNGAELCGPCPKCGGTDRFYVTQDGHACACRQCHPQRMDVVGVIAWLQCVSQHEALDMLAGRRTFVRVRTPAPSATATLTQDEDAPNATNSAAWRTDAAQAAQDACARLHTDGDGARDARRYLLSRGLQPETWQAFGLGYDRVPVPKTKVYARAVSWPIVHEETGETYGVRYRFLETQTDGDGKEYRYTSRLGSRTSGRLFGVPALPAGVLLPWDGGARLHGEASRCLVICEGEFNAMSVWQCSHKLDTDVLSFGSESQRTLPAWAVTIAQRYGACVIWLDSPDKTHDVAQQLPHAKALRSVLQDGHKLDANAMLVAGQLGGLIAAARLSVLRERRESVLWQFYDARDSLDAGQRIVAARLALELGKSVTF